MPADRPKPLPFGDGRGAVGFFAVGKKASGVLSFCSRRTCKGVGKTAMMPMGKGGTMKRCLSRRFYNGGRIWRHPPAS